jgi:hypothetical protein
MTMPAYGVIPWGALTAAVGEATGAGFTPDTSYYIGHQMCGINFNSLNRIVSAFTAPLQQQLGECSGGYETMGREVVALQARIAELEAELAQRNRPTTQADRGEV